MGKPLYLDYAATTPVDPGVARVMMEWLVPGHTGNAHARHHPHGQGAYRAVEQARQQIAVAINAAPDRLCFTSGATEGNNLVLRGIAPALKQSGRTHIITSAVEHKSVLEPLAALDGLNITILPVKPCGMVDEAMLERAITPQTGMVCLQAVNNELGVIQPLEEIAAMLKGRGILLHIDAAQALGKIPLDVARLQADFMVLSAHKMHGPQGIGAVYSRVPGLVPMHLGGGQENGLRAGTVPVFLCAGFGAACEAVTPGLIAAERARLQILRDHVLSHLAPLNPVIGGHSDPAWNVPHILNLRFPGIDQDSLVMAMPELSFGTGSACSGGPSHVMRAVTGSDQAAREAIRLSFGRLTEAAEMERAAEIILRVVTEIKTMQEVA